MEHYSLTIEDRAICMDTVSDMIPRAAQVFMTTEDETCSDRGFIVWTFERMLAASCMSRARMILQAR